MVNFTAPTSPLLCRPNPAFERLVEDLADFSLHDPDASSPSLAVDGITDELATFSFDDPELQTSEDVALDLALLVC